MRISAFALICVLTLTLSGCGTARMEENANLVLRPASYGDLKGWTQDDAGAVHVRLLEPVPARARRALDAEAARLTDWLAGLRVPTVYKSPAMKAPLTS